MNPRHPHVGDQRQQLLSQEKRPFELDVQQLIELRLGGLDERHMDADAGVVDQEVETIAVPVFLQRGMQLVGELLRGQQRVAQVALAFAMLVQAALQPRQVVAQPALEERDVLVSIAAPPGTSLPRTSMRS